MKIYSLTHDYSSYVDQDGVSWDDPLSWLWVGVMGGCGCGSSEELEMLAWRTLSLFALPINERSGTVYDDLTLEIIAHWLDHVGLLEHGTSIGYSWLNDSGKSVHAAVLSHLESKA